MKERESRSKIRTRFHPNKTFKIYPFYNQIFSACISLSDRDVLKDYLIRRFLGNNELNLVKMNKAELFEKIIKDVSKSKREFDSFYKLYNAKRFKELKTIYEQTIPDGEKVREAFNIRTSEETIKKVFTIAEKTGIIGEAIELAIINYIYNLNNEHYELVKFTFELDLKNKKNNHLS